MSSLRQLEDRLRAWRSFRGIARATRTLAAAQSLHWNEIASRAEAHLRRCLEVHGAYPNAQPPADGPRVVLAIGSDLGLCGPFNRSIAAHLPAVLQGAARHVVVGARLGLLLGDEVAALPSPSSFERVEALATELELLLEDLPPTTAQLELVLASGVEPDGRPQVEVLPEPRGGEHAPRSAVELSASDQAEPVVALTTRHARIVAALTRSAASETEARWRTMNRAHDAADRRIGEQERALRKQRQELVTQEMLEARQGGHARP